MRRIWIVGDNVDTDRIIAGKYTKTLDTQVFRDHVFEDLEEIDGDLVKPGDVLVAGENFGCGSSREQAALAIRSLGLECVIAKSFARIFFRNGINVGLPLMSLPDHKITAASDLKIQFADGKVEDLNANKVYTTEPLPGFLIDIMNSGGLVPFLKEHQSYNL